MLATLSTHRSSFQCAHELACIVKFCRVCGNYDHKTYINLCGVVVPLVCVIGCDMPACMVHRFAVYSGAPLRFSQRVFKLGHTL
jgi:hypothetical protein